MPNRQGVWSLSAVYQALGDQNWIMAPGAPTGVSATAGDAQATVSFTAPTFEGIPAGITGYRATSNPGGLTGTGSSSPVTVTGLTNGTSYTFTVQATNSIGYGPEGGPSGSVSPAQPRAVFGGGEYTGSSPYYTNVMDYRSISSLGNLSDFGDLTVARTECGGASSATRGVFIVGSNTSGNNQNVMDYITIASTGNALDFGDYSYVSQSGAAVSNSTRGVQAGGYDNTFAATALMKYITIASTGNSSSFGSLTQARINPAGCNSPTRGVFGGGAVGATEYNIMDYITIASTGNASDFGDLDSLVTRMDACSSETRGVFGGGFDNSSTHLNTMQYITIASTGNTTDFGDLSTTRVDPMGTSSSTRGLFAGGNISGGGGTTYADSIDYITIATTGNSSDFGDLSLARQSGAGVSNAHGGLQ